VKAALETFDARKTSLVVSSFRVAESGCVVIAETKSGMLRRSKKYAHAPITEAIIEVRVTPNPETTATSCKTVFQGISEQLPEMSEMLLMQAQISGGDRIGAQATQQLAGYVWNNKERGQVVTVQPDRFSYSQLAPYDRWETFCPRARDLWETYRARTSPQHVVRVATRFVNRIEIPLPITDIEDYFRTAPRISPDMSQDLSGSFMQLHLPQKNSGCIVILTQAILNPEEGIVPFILDIDVADQSSEFSTDEIIWERLEEFRWRKNDIFEACITDRVRDLIS